MSTLVKDVLVTSVIPAATVFNPKLKLKADRYCRPQPAIRDALFNSSCCEKKGVSSLLVPVLPRLSPFS